MWKQRIKMPQVKHISLASNYTDSKCQWHQTSHTGKGKIQLFLHLYKECCKNLFMSFPFFFFFLYNFILFTHDISGGKLAVVHLTELETWKRNYFVIICRNVAMNLLYNLLQMWESCISVLKTYNQKLLNIKHVLSTYILNCLYQLFTNCFNAAACRMLHVNHRSSNTDTSPSQSISFKHGKPKALAFDDLKIRTTHTCEGLFLKPILVSWPLPFCFYFYLNSFF